MVENWSIITMYCLYFHINPVKQEIFYIGIGDMKRPYQTRSRNKHWKHIVKKYGYEIIIIHNNLSWENACELEIKYIAQLGRHDLKIGTLVNKTNGGDGTIGIPFKKRKPLSQAHKDSIRNKLLGRKHSKETLELYKKPRNPHSEITKDRIRQALLKRNRI